MCRAERPRVSFLTARVVGVLRSSRGATRSCVETTAFAIRFASAYNACLLNPEFEATG